MTITNDSSTSLKIEGPSRLEVLKINDGREECITVSCLDKGTKVSKEMSASEFSALVIRVKNLLGLLYPNPESRMSHKIFEVITVEENGVLLTAKYDEWAELVYKAPLVFMN